MKDSSVLVLALVLGIGSRVQAASITVNDLGTISEAQSELDQGLPYLVRGNSKTLPLQYFLSALASFSSDLSDGGVSVHDGSAPANDEEGEIIPADDDSAPRNLPAPSSSGAQSPTLPSLAVVAGTAVPRDAMDALLRIQRSDFQAQAIRSTGAAPVTRAPVTAKKKWIRTAAPKRAMLSVLALGLAGLGFARWRRQRRLDLS